MTGHYSPCPTSVSLSTSFTRTRKRETLNNDVDRIQISGIRYDDKSLARYAWDHRDRLVQVVVDGEPTAYSYDYRNRLVRRNDEIFVHDGWQTVMRLKNGSVAQRYLWGAKQDELLCENDSHVLCDHLSSVQKVVDGNGKVVSSLKYSAFGELLNEPDDEIAFAYTGKLFDAKTGLQWNINRWYDPKVGRWISEDPIGFEAKDANLVRYVGNEVVGKKDMNGLWKYVAQMGHLKGSLGPLLAEEIGNEADKYSDATSSFRLTFFHYKEKFDSKCCNRLKFIQIYFAKFSTYSLITRLTPNRWMIDADQDTAPYYKNSTSVMPVSQAVFASLTDEPSFFSLSQYSSTSLSLELETCAICSEGKDKGDVYACIEWGHAFSLKGRGPFKSINSLKRYVDHEFFGTFQLLEKTDEYGKPVFYGEGGIRTYSFDNKGKQPTENMKSFLDLYFP